MAEESEKRSPVFDWENGEFLLDHANNVMTVTEQEAAEQIIIKALQTARGAFLIYANVDDEDLHHKYGSDVPDIQKDGTISQQVKEDEIKRAVEEALIYLDWVNEVNNIALNTDNADPEVSLDVVTVFDRVIEIKGAALQNE